MKRLDIARYVGIPYVSKGRTYDGCDCWGLLRLVYLEQLGVELPSYADDNADAAEVSETRRVVEAKRDSWERVAIPRPGDAVLMKIHGEPVHVGVYIGDGEMLHVRGGANACVQRLSAPFWRQAFEGFYRYAE